VPALETSTLRKEYGELVAVNNLNLSVEKGQVVGLIGPNGAGKTTLLRMLATLLQPSSGSVSVLGLDLKTRYQEVRRHLAYLPDFFSLYNDLTIRECIEFFALAYQVPAHEIPGKVRTILDYIELEHKQDELVRNLSRGMVQRLGVGAMLVHDPEILLLDEPASGLDPKARIQLRQVLRKMSDTGKTIIISSHILTELSGFCSHLVIMNNGNVQMAGKVDEIERRVSGARSVQIRVLNEIDKAVALVRDYPGATVTAVDNDRIRVEMEAEVDELAQLNRVLVENGILVAGLTEEKANLEDLFMKICSSEEPLPAEGGDRHAA
jgi:ABC-2 type transport system ATP-binding protein